MAWRSKIFPLATQLKATPPARQTAFAPVFGGEFLQHAEVNLFEPRLKRGSQVAMALLDRFIGLARGLREDAACYRKTILPRMGVWSDSPRTFPGRSL